MIRICGAVLTMLGCGGVGFSMSRNYQREEQGMQELIRGLEWMICQMNYRMPPLASLFQGAADVCEGAVSRTLEQIGFELEQRITSNVVQCVHTAIEKVPDLPAKTADQLYALGTSLGHFDLEGQIMQLKAAVSLCRQELERLNSEKDTRIRMYQTLGICVGVAVVIILI